MYCIVILYCMYIVCMLYVCTCILFEKEKKRKQNTHRNIIRGNRDEKVHKLKGLPCYKVPHSLKSYDLHLYYSLAFHPRQTPKHKKKEFIIHGDITMVLINRKADKVILVTFENKLIHI